MATVGAFEAKTHLAALLDRVAKGETVEITKRGVPVARLVPVDKPAKRTPAEAVEALRELRKGITLGDITIQELIREGRRY
jgi:prevent-host-death family protein